MGRPLSPQGCPRCEGTVYIEKDPWEEDDEYLVCWRCGHVLSEEEVYRLIQLRCFVYLKSQRKAS